MLHIAVCDDDISSVQNNAEIAERCLKSSGSIGQINTYTDSSNLLYDITEDNKFFDLILLDIEMPKNSGMELVEKIKPSLPNVKVIFITSHIEYAIDAFELSIFRYVPKNEIDKRLLPAIKDAVKLLELEDGRIYTIHNNNRLEKIQYKDIFYIERDGKNVCITTANGISKVRRSLQQIYEELSSEEFIFIDCGYIVNMIYIMRIKDGEAILKNGISLPISRSHLQSVKEQINNYWGMHI